MVVGCKYSLSKICLICINVGFLLFGLGSLIIGTLMKFDVLSIKDITKAVLNSVEVQYFDFGNLADNLWILFIAIGVLFLVASVLGLRGACNQNKALLTIYAVFVLVLSGITIVVIVLWLILKNGTESDFKAQLVQNLHKNFVNDSVSNGNDISYGWNIMFMSLDCCAVNPVNTTTNDFDNTPWCTTSGDCQLTNAEIPKTCCIGVTKTNYTSAPESCFYNLNPGSYNTKGCYQAIKEFLKENITSKTHVVLAVGIIIFLLEVLSVITSIALCRRSFKV